MTITQRLVRATAPAAAPDVRPEEVLDRLAVSTMIGVMNQLGQLAEYAAEVFQNLYDVASKTGTRITNVRNRVSSLGTELNKAEHTLSSKDASYFYSTQKTEAAWRRADDLSFSLFVPTSQSIALRNARAEAKPVPQLNLLDPYAEDNVPCTSKFSNPRFFFEKWLEAEQERQKKAAEDRDKRKKKKKKRPQVQNAPKPTAQAVTQKVFSAMGSEFADLPQARPAVQTSSMPAEPRADAGGDSHATAGGDDDDELKAPISWQQRPSLSLIAGQTLGGSVMAPPPPPPPPAFDGYGAPPPPPVPYGIPAVPTPPPSTGMDYSMPPPVPQPLVNIPAPPPVVIANIPPPPPIFATPIPPPVPTDSSSGDSSAAAAASSYTAPAATGFLAEIQAGANLRRVEPTAKVERRGSARGGLLDEIRNRNYRLKKVEVQQAKPAATAAAPGGLASIMDILSRRAAIEGSDDEESDDGDWDDS